MICLGDECLGGSAPENRSLESPRGVVTRVAAAKKARVRPGGELRSGSMKRAAQLRISEKIEGQDRILNFQGSADILAMPAVQELLARYSREDIRLLLFDLSETEFINSPVWAVITLYARKRRTQVRVAIVGMSERIKGSFEMMGLQKELLTFADVETARRELLD
jgi:anti-anti-sigma factor